MKKRKLTEETRSMPWCQFAAGCDFMLRLLSIVTVFVTVASAYGIQQPEEPPLAPERPKLINNAASAVGERAAEVQLKRLTSEEPQLVLDTGAFLGEIVELAFSSNGSLVAAVGDRVVRIFDVESSKLVNTLRGELGHYNYGEPQSIAFSPDGRDLLVGVNDDAPHGSIRVYTTDDFSQIDSLLEAQKTPCLKIAFSRDCKYLATADSNGQINLWDWPRRAVLKNIPSRFPKNPIIQTLKFADTEPYLVAVDRNATTIYRVPDGQRMTDAEYVPPRVLGWVRDDIGSEQSWPFSATTPNPVFPTVFDLRLERSLWAAVGMGRNESRNQPWAAVWRSGETNQLVPPRPLIYTKHRWNVTAIAISPTGNLMASGDKFGEIHLWDATTADTLHRMVSQGEPFYEAAFDASATKICFDKTPDLAKWSINNYGTATQILDLKQKTVRRVTPEELASTQQELTQQGGLSVKFRPPNSKEFGDLLTLSNGGNTLSTYRVPGGRKTSVLTLLPKESLGVKHPVLFAADDGLFAMWDSARDEMRRFFAGHSSLITSISVAPSCNVVVTGSTDRTMRIWSLLNYRPIGTFDFKYKNSEVTFVPVGSAAAKAGVQIGDQIVSLGGIPLIEIFERMLLNQFDYKPGQAVKVQMRRGATAYSYTLPLVEGFDSAEPLLNIFIGDQQQWIAWTPAGYYDCSPGADQLVGWHVNQGPEKSAKFFHVQQFRRQLFRPDIIDEVIKTGVAADATAVANHQHHSQPSKADLRNRTSFDAARPPVCVIQSPKSLDTFNDPRVNVNATIQSVNDLPIVSVTMLHNGVATEVFRPKTADEGRTLNINHRIRLFSGRNEISLLAANSTSTSAPEDCRIILEAPQVEEKAKVFALAIGISEYTNGGKGFENLKFAADDAESFVSTLKQHTNGKLYDDIHIRCLTNQDATRASILDGLQWLVDNVQQDDVVMLFVSAHGFLDDRNGFYLGTHDVDAMKLRSTAVAWNDVITLLHEELPACRRIAFIDACHSAGLADGTIRNPLHDLAAPELGTIFYASCTLQQESFEKEEWRHGAFTKAILDLVADRTRDTSPRTGDGFVNAFELAAGVRDSVSVMTGDRQTPVIYAPEAIGRINLLEFQGK